MASQKTKFMVGLFLAGGIGIGVVAFILLGMSRFLEKGNNYVTYFNESVQGLDVDSSVKYRGVPVGRVERIQVAPDSKLIKVVLKIETGQALDRDIVAQMKSVGITGAVFIELDRKKEGEPDRSPPLSFPSEYPIVSSRPSDISQIFQGIDEVIGKMNRVDFEGISARAGTILDKLDHAFADMNVKGLSRSVEASLEGLRKILGDPRWNSLLANAERASGSLNELLERGREAVSSAEKVFAGVDGVLAENRQAIRTALEELGRVVQNANQLLEKSGSVVSGTNDTVVDLKKDLLFTMQNLAHASENLNRLIELLLDQPSQLLLGEAPEPRKIEPDSGRKH